MRISDHCRVTVRVRAGFRVRVRNMVRVSNRVSVRVGVADCCIQTAGKSDKMRINHVIKTDQLRSAPQIRPAPHFVVSRKKRRPYVDSLTGGTTSLLLSEDLRQ